MSTLVPKTGGVQIDETPGGALILRLTRTEVGNALSVDLVEELIEHLDRAGAEARPAVLLASSGQVFCGGMDLRGVESADDAELRTRFRRIGTLIETLASAPFVTIACIDGPAVGAGADLVLACDHRLGGRRTTLRFPGPRFGLLLGTARLAQLVGNARAQEIVLTQKSLDAEAAWSSGLLTAIPASHDVEGAGIQLADAACSAVVSIPHLVRLMRGAELDATAALEKSMSAGLAERMRTYASEQQRGRR